MALSPSERGYAFQHAIKDFFLELGFVAQEEHPATRTDICLSHPPLDIAVECKHVTDGVTLDHVQRFDERLKQWQKIRRPCLGVMVATWFQEEAKALCSEKNILYVTQQQIEDAIQRKRSSRFSDYIPISNRVNDFLRAFSGLLDSWIPHFFGDPLGIDSVLLQPLLSQGYASIKTELVQGKVILDYSDKGKGFFAKCRLLFDLLPETDHRYSDPTQIAWHIVTALTEIEDLQAYDKIVLVGLGFLEHTEKGLKPSTFADNLLGLFSGPT